LDAANRGVRVQVRSNVLDLEFQVLLTSLVGTLQILALLMIATGVEHRYLEGKMFQKMRGAVRVVGFGSAASINPYSHRGCLGPWRVLSGDLCEQSALINERRAFDAVPSAHWIESCIVSVIARGELHRPASLTEATLKLFGLAELGGSHMRAFLKPLRVYRRDEAVATLVALGCDKEI
jgi:hypothetical protein